MEKKQFNEDNYFDLLKFIFEKSSSGYIVEDKNGELIKTNKAHEKITGYSEEMIKEINSNHMKKDFSENKISSTKLVLEKNEEIIIQQHQILKDRNILVRGIPYYDKNGEIQYVISELIDIEKHNKIMKDINKEVKDKIDGKCEKVVTNKSILEEESTDFIVYKSKVMSDIMEKARIIANSDVTTLILGESGTGKELLAKYIHRKSLRKDKPFVKINCSALPENLLESELFGYEPGSFTGGISGGKKGLLEYADKGTILLDEIGDMAINLQSKILRFLQEKEIMRIGGNQNIKVDVRVIATTNVDLVKLINDSKFREDLYYRLNVVPINLPCLRERKEDIPLLVHYFTKHFNHKYKKNKSLDEELLTTILEKAFSGNIRQLSNLIERLIIMTQNDLITLNDYNNLNYDENDINKHNKYNSFIDESKTYDEMKIDFEKQILKEYKKKYKTTSNIAKKLEVNQSTISRKLNKYDIK